MSFAETLNDVVAYFLTEYPLNSKPSSLREIVYDRARLVYSDEVTERFVELSIDNIRRTLVDEFDNRYQQAASLRYQILDEEGDEISGAVFTEASDLLLFQNALNEMDAADFEKLSAFILNVAGCTDCWSTPESHDQGLDAFGHWTYLDSVIPGVAAPRITMLAQAKHYNGHKVGTGEIREFVGSAALAKHKIYATYDERYEQLEILPLSPLAHVFITSEEIPRTVKLLSNRSGVVVLTSDDLFVILMKKWPKRPNPLTKEWIANQLKECIDKIEKAE
jgi:hypothetical protein